MGDAERVRDAFDFFVQFHRPADGVPEGRSFVEHAGVAEHAVVADEDPFRGSRFESEGAFAFEPQVVQDRIRFIGDVDVGVAGRLEDRRGAHASRRGRFLCQPGGRSSTAGSGPLPARPDRRLRLRRPLRRSNRGFLSSRRRLPPPARRRAFRRRQRPKSRERAGRRRSRPTPRRRETPCKQQRSYSPSRGDVTPGLAGPRGPQARAAARIESSGGSRPVQISSERAPWRTRISMPSTVAAPAASAARSSAVCAPP